MLKKNAPSNFISSSMFVPIASTEFTELPIEEQVKGLRREVIDIKRRVREMELAYLELEEEEDPNSDEILLSSTNESFSPPYKKKKNY
jgi:hypothetical protein